MDLKGWHEGLLRSAALSTIAQSPILSHPADGSPFPKAIPSANLQQDVGGQVMVLDAQDKAKYNAQIDEQMGFGCQGG